MLQRLASHPLVVWGERVLLAVLLLWVLHRLGPQLSALTGIGPTEGSTPGYVVAALDGTTWSSDSLRGRVVVVNFWATWCLPCRVEIPALQSLHEDYADGEVIVLGVSTDVGGADRVRAYLQERGVTYPVGRAGPSIRRAFGGVSALPTTFLIDRDGVVRHRVVGLFAPPALRAAVRRLVREDRGDGGDEPAGL